MALEDDVEQALRDAGTQLKAGLWQESDTPFLQARARDLIGLNLKAASATDPLKKRAYLAAARDVVGHVKLMAIIRMEVATANVVDDLSRFFMDKVLPLLRAVLPALVEL